MTEGYDGSIKLSVSLSADDVKRSAQTLSNTVKDIFDKSAGKELDSKFQRLQSAMSKSVAKAQELQSAMERLENTNVPTQEYQEIQKQIDKATDSLVKLLDKQQKFIETGGNTKSKVYKGMEYEVDELRKTISYAEGELQELVDSGKAFKLGSETEEYDNLKNQLGDVNNQMRILTTSAEQYSNKADKATDSTKKFNNEVQKSSNKQAGFAEGLSKTVFKFAKYAFGIRSAYIAFQKLKRAIASGLTSIAMMNGGMNSANASISKLVSSLNYLKGALASAFLPIINVVSPILSNFIDQIAQVITAIGMMIAKLTGATSFTKVVKKNTDYAASQAKGGSGKSAQEKYEEKVKKAQETYDKKVAQTEQKNADRMAKAEEKQAKAAKKLAKEQEKANNKLASFDDLNVLGVEALEDMEEAEADLLEMPELEMPEMDMSGAGGSDDPFGLEEVALEPMENTFLDWLKDMIDAFVDGFDSAWDRLDLDSRIARLKGYFQQIKDAFMDILTDEMVTDAFNNMSKAFMHMLGSLSADLISIGVSLATFIVGGIAQYLSEAGTVQRIKDYLIEMFNLKEVEFKQLEEFHLALADIFTVLESPEALAFSENFVGIFAEAFMNTTLLLQKFENDFVKLITQPIIDNVSKIKRTLIDTFGQLNAILEPLRQVLDDFGQRLNQLYDEHIHPLMESVTTGISDLIEFALDIYNSFVKPFIDELVNQISDLVENHVGPALDAIIAFLEPVIDLLKLLWDNILVPFFAFTIAKLQALMAVISVAFDIIIMIGKLIIDIITSIINIFKDLLQFIVDIFTVGWSQAWDNLKEKVSGWVEDIGKYFSVSYWKGLAGNIVDGLKQGLSEGWDNFKDGAGAIGKKLIAKFRDDTETHSPSRKAEDVGIDIVAGLFLPFSDNTVSQHVTPFAQSILNILREILTGENASSVGLEMANSLIEGLTVGMELINTFITEQFLELTELLLEQFNSLMESVFSPTWEKFLSWFDKSMKDWWDNHVQGPWFTNEKWEESIYKPWEAYRDQKWTALMKWWDTSMQDWWEHHVVVWFAESKWEEQFDKVYKTAQKVGEKTRDKITELADETTEVVINACNSMVDAIQSVIAALGEALALAAEFEMGGGITANFTSSSSQGGGGKSSAGGGRVRGFMPALDIMHFEDNLGMSAFKFPELATGAVIPPNNRFLAVLGDQQSGINIETPLATMLEAFRSVMDEYTSPAMRNATMEVDGETFARLMMPYMMDEMHRIGYNTEIIEGV